MIYVDTSVILSELFAEDGPELPELRSVPLISSRLLEYEVWNRVHARRIMGSLDPVHRILQSVSLVELSPLVLARALEPFPTPTRTLDALHLSTAQYLVERRIPLRLATLDRQMAAAACALGLEVIGT